MGYASDRWTEKLRKGIILAGGTGTRLHPLTLGVSKQLMPVYDKPMIYYPLCTLMLAAIREFLIITTPDDRESFRKVLGDGSAWGIAIDYAVQDEPRGIADAYRVGADFVDGEPSALILGDNVFYGHGLAAMVQEAARRSEGASLFAYRVNNPGAYGVVSFDDAGSAISIEEKPVHPQSAYAVTGLYFFDGSAADRARNLRPSARGELEITDLNRSYLDDGQLNVDVMGRGMAWLDTGTHQSLIDAGTYVRIIEERQGLKICCPEEIAWRSGFIDDDQLKSLAQPLRHSGYGEYLLGLLDAAGPAGSDR